ncbi:MAG TPA: hypothetical protein VE377_09400 [Candidatus Dormibacteraeota bacterium]|nr:hypothetical protein [Candidatus Dormibacteraeota bacterium]
MRGQIKIAGISAIVLFAVAGTLLQAKTPSDDRDSVVIVYKDGHRQSLAAAQIASIDLKAATIVYKDGHREKVRAAIDRIEFEDASASTSSPGRSHFIGKWEVGQGNGNSTFLITLKENGDAKKSIGAPHGTWTLVDGEARIAWDDGWHDAIRKVGTKHEKFAYEPGKSFGDEPTNVTEARNTQPRPI